MTKKLLLLAIIGLLGLVGCGKDEEQQLDAMLVGTKWQTRDTAYELIYGGTAYNVYEFTSTTHVEDYITKNNNVVKSNGTHKYELTYPNLTIRKENGTIYEFEFKDSRTLERKTESNFYKTYIKQ